MRLPPDPATLNPAKRRRCIALVAAVLLAGCSVDPEKGAQQYLRSGGRLMNQQRYAEAVGQFQNALKLTPNSVDALCRLAQAHVANRHWAESYAAFQRAIALEPGRLEAHLGLARLLLAAHDYQRAEAEAKYVLNRDPGNSGAFDVLGPSRAMQGDYPAAREVFSTLVKLQPRKPEGYLSLARVNIALRRFDDAEQALVTAIAVDPGYEQSYVHLAGLYRLMHLPAKAEAVMRDVVRGNPSSIGLNVSLAELLSLQGRTADVEPVFRKLTERLPRSAAAAVAIGDFYLARGDRFRAAEAYGRGMRADPSNLEPRQRMVDWYLEGGQWKEAQPVNDAILREHPKDASAGIAGGRILLAQNRVDEAIAQLRVQAREAADSWQAHYYLGQAYWLRGRQIQAREELQQALRLSPENMLVCRSLTELTLESGDFALALQTAETAVRMRPADVQPRLLLGTVLLRQRKLASAREQFATALKLDPGDPGVHLNLGLVDVAEGRDASAEQEFEAALNMDSRLSPALSELAELLAKQSVQKAVDRIMRHLARNPVDAQAHFLLGSLHARAGQFAAAKGELAHAADLDPGLWQANMRLAEVFQALGDTKASILQYERVLTTQPESAVVHGTVASLYFKTGDLAEARKHYERALAIDPRLGWAANNLAWVYLNQPGDLDAALRLAQRARELLPDSPSPADTVGWILNKKGMPSAAIPILRDCVDKTPSSATFRYHLGMALLAGGRNREARAELEMARRLKLPPEDDEAARGALAGP